MQSYRNHYIWDVSYSIDVLIRRNEIIPIVSEHTFEMQC